MSDSTQPAGSAAPLQRSVVVVVVVAVVVEEVAEVVVEVVAVVVVVVEVVISMQLRSRCAANGWCWPARHGWHVLCVVSLEM